jgi:nucleoside-diphosphate-sugar epimerase
VRCCVRDATNPLKTAHLLAMNEMGATGSVSLHTADLLTPGDYDEPFAGCCGVFHAGAVLERDHAGGMAGSGDDVTGEDIYRGGFDATKNVLESVEKSGTVKRVVFTSSTAAVMGAKPYPHVHSEADWSDGGDRDGPKIELPVAYAKSKCDSERLAYDWAERVGLKFDCISHQPAHVMG